MPAKAVTSAATAVSSMPASGKVSTKLISPPKSTPTKKKIARMNRKSTKRPVLHKSLYPMFKGVES